MTKHGSPEIDDRPARRVDEVLDGVRVAMLTTETADGLEARPLTIVAQDIDTLWFLVSRSAHWVNAATLSGQDSLLAFEDVRHSSYVCLVGTLRLDDEPARVRALWTAPARAYFDGPDDPDVVALAFDVTGGRWWDGPDSRIGQSLALARAIVTHDSTKVGDVGPVVPGRGLTPPAVGPTGSYTRPDAGAAMSTWPTTEQVQTFLDGPADRPVVMLNLLEFKAHATGEYEGLSGQEAVLVYSRAMREFVEAHGGTFVLAANIDSQLIGDGGERFGFVGIMRYPSRAAYLALAGDPEIAATIGKHREAGLESQWLFAMSELTE